MTVFNIERTYNDKRIRRWPNVYWCIDVHDVILEGKYKTNNDGAQYLPNALKVLKFLTNKPETVLILWTSGHIGPTAKVLEDLEKQGIRFKYVNENRDCPNDHLCDFTKKFYMNIVLDDKCGFENDDWFLVEKELKRIGQWEQ